MQHAISSTSRRPLRERLATQLVDRLLSPRTLARVRAWEAKHPAAAQAFADGLVRGASGRPRR